MKLFGMALAFNMASILCALAALFLAFHGKDGWGWFLFGAILLHCYPSSGKDE
jgi:hypothetical protein